ncbi:MAG: hypothetical protein SFU56_11840 [Capsulimonadales bacterium]|nr:hypothetical protein [Capsulimonadales bacterium]
MRFLILLLAGVILSGPAVAQTKKTTAKPPARPTAGQPYVLGTKQLPGEFGKIGQEYTIGVNNPINITLRSAAYLVDRVFLDTIGEGKITWFPAAGKKFLRLDLIIKNSDPRQRETGAGLAFTVVDANDENRQSHLVLNARNGAEMRTGLKPGQAVEVFTLLEVPSEGEVPKLIVQREDGAAVVRYDLRGKAAPLPNWAGEGANARDRIDGVRDALHPAHHFDIGLRGLEWSKEVPDGDPPVEGERVLIAHLTFRAATGGVGLNFATFLTTVKTADGEEIVRDAPGGTGGFLTEKRNDSYAATPEKGEIIRTRVFFRLKEGNEGAAPKTLTIKDEASQRTFRFEISDQDWFSIRDCVRDLRTGQAIVQP